MWLLGVFTWAIIFTHKSWCVSVQIFTKGCVPLHPNCDIPFSPIIYIYTSRIINSIYHPRHYPSILEYPIHIFNINIQQSDYEYPITYPVTSPCILLSYLIISHHILSYLIISHHISLYLIIYHYISLYIIIFEYIIMSHYVSLCLIASYHD